MRCNLPLLISLLALSAGCAAPAGDGPVDPGAGDQPPGAVEGARPAAAPEPEPPAGTPPRTEPSPQPPPGPSLQASAEPQTPSWWSETPVWQGDQVRVCAEATAPTLRQARQQAIRAAYDRLEGELGGPATTAAIGSDYDATRVGDVWRFRVRVTGER